jgi:hypothetical protein
VRCLDRYGRVGAGVCPVISFFCKGHRCQPALLFSLLYRFIGVMYGGCAIICPKFFLFRVSPLICCSKSDVENGTFVVLRRRLRQKHYTAGSCPIEICVHSNSAALHQAGLHTSFRNDAAASCGNVISSISSQSRPSVTLLFTSRPSSVSL